MTNHNQKLIYKQ